jgi:hypothetical protein
MGSANVGPETVFRLCTVSFITSVEIRPTHQLFRPSSRPWIGTRLAPNHCVGVAFSERSVLHFTFDLKSNDRQSWSLIRHAGNPLGLAQSLDTIYDFISPVPRVRGDSEEGLGYR